MKACRLIAQISVLVSWSVAFINYARLPDIIPIHFDGAGNANGFGSKLTIFLMPMIATVLIFGINQLAKYPHIFNYPQPVTDENRERLYKSGVKTLYVVNAITGLILLLAVVSTIDAAQKVDNKMSGWVLPLIIILSVALTLYAIAGAIRSTRKI